MQIFKFGGAALKDAEAVTRIAELLIAKHRAEPCPRLIVVSAMGKTTNALEAILEAKVKGEVDLALQRLEALHQSHQNTAQALFAQAPAAVLKEALAALNDWFVEAQWCVEDEVHEDYDYDYDQLVALGEMFSSCLVSHYFRYRGLPLSWFDVRDAIRTDNRYRDAGVDWSLTRELVQEKLLPKLEGEQIILTQGFIGGTSENFTTTLGREGSDYTAAILAHCLQAAELSVWKDVPGILSGDPDEFPEASLLPELSYSEAIEMTFNGAKVIHPKTLRPLQQLNIPLRVRSFLQPQGPGTRISAQGPKHYPPVFVLQRGLMLWQLRSLDWHFLQSDRLAELLQKAAQARLQVHFWQTRALSIALCLDAEPRRLARFRQALAGEYELESEQIVNLLCVRHPQGLDLEALAQDKQILLRQASDELLRWVFVNG